MDQLHPDSIQLDLPCFVVVLAGMLISFDILACLTWPSLLSVVSLFSLSSFTLLVSCFPLTLITVIGLICLARLTKLRFFGFPYLTLCSSFVFLAWFSELRPLSFV